MPGKLTSGVLESSLKCRFKAYLKTAGEQGQPHDYEILMQESREQIRLAARTRLLSQHEGQEVLSGLPLTTDLLKRGLPLLLDCTFEDEDLSVPFDALLRVDGESSLGKFYYQPVIFHPAEKATPELRLLLAMYDVILGAVQGKESATGVLIVGRACNEQKAKLDSVLGQARRLLREAREGRNGPPPRLILNSHCQICEFRQQCHTKAAANNDLSLLRGIGQKEIGKYAKRGIFSITQLSCIFRPPRRMKKPDDRKVTHSHALQALAIREKKVHIVGNPKLPTSAKRIYFDVEGDPDRGFDYLIGFLVQDGEKEEKHSFWIDLPGEESMLLGRFLEIAGRHPDAWFYAYGSYEVAFLRRVAKAAGREEEVGRVLARTFNVLTVVYLHVYFPVHSNSLKDIAGHFGFQWSDPDSSGVQSLVWRRRWEEGGSAAFKEKLLIYNLEDCKALQRVTEFLYEVCRRPQNASQQPTAIATNEVERVEETTPPSSRPHWCVVNFAVADFEFVNKRAYFDYQRDRVYVRTNKTIRKSQEKTRTMNGKKNLRVNQCVELHSENCPSCGSVDVTLTQDSRLARLAYDLRITPGGIRRWVTRFTTNWHHCASCRKRFLPRDYLRLEEHFHSLKCWAMYQYVAHRASLTNIAETIRDSFGLPINQVNISIFKQLLSKFYKNTYETILERLRTGYLIHADETEITLKQLAKGYVWVFASLEEVVFIYRKSRAGDFLHDLLKGFSGVLVSDYYAAYDSLDCPQQKCLIHLIRDFNQDIQGNPWDEELKSLAGKLGSLLRGIVATIDQYGLKCRYLVKHKKDVDRFFESLTADTFHSEVATSYRDRLLKSRDKLFTFLDHDGVPWNNNPAEHAVKQFAYYRENIDGQITENGLNEYLVLLSICVTCKYKGVSFLKFLLSGEKDIDVFSQNRRKKRSRTLIQTYPDDVKLPRASRSQTWDKESSQAETDSIDQARRGGSEELCNG
jgi:predicted RecB family nuclease